MIRCLLVLLVGTLLVTLTSCGSTTTRQDPAQADFAALMARHQAQQEADVARLTSDYYSKKWWDEVGDDFGRHNWIEYPYAAIMWGFSWLSTGHQKRDFVKMHRNMDRYFFNAAWNDPYLND